MEKLLLIPRVSEKAYGQSKNGTYVFTVPTNANQQRIAAAVEAEYGVKVASVNVLVAKGKRVAARRGKRSAPVMITRKDVKKAYVTLVEGDSIKLFDDEEQK